ncbi:MAG: glycosyltransferase family protein [Magnetococcales bacterium]|nr:glycosyltransferase family protein [Magnetococcales bacterium]
MPPSGPLDQAFLLHANGLFAAALAEAQRILATQGQDPLLWHLIASCHLDLDRPEQAAACWREATRLAPEWAAAWFHLGVALATRERFDLAEAAYRAAVRLDPGHAEGFYNWGVALAALQRVAEAETAYREATRLQPRLADAHYNLGVVLAEQQRPDEAEIAWREALAVQPDHPEAWYNLGVHLRDRGEDAHAEAALRAALRARPDFPDALWDLSLLLLAQERFAEGWAGFDARLDQNKSNLKLPPVELPFPQWRGEPLAGRSLMVLPEQGFGDQLQFCRYVPLLKQAGAGMVTLVCPAPLVPLFATLEGVDRVVAEAGRDACPPHDCWIHLLSLPHRLGGVLPNTLPYLRVPGDRLAFWKERLPASGIRVGLAWQGNPSHPNDRWRSLPGLETLRPLWSLPGLTFISLQKGSFPAVPELPLLQTGDAWRDFADTAAIVAQLDLVITIDSAVAHLAGALGIPCRVLLPARGVDWRWGRGRSESVWYPKIMRLIHQSRPDTWSDAIASLTAWLF